MGPNAIKDKASILGIAAHITAASVGGPRYDANLSVGQRKDIDNGIWLCANCATLIDKDPNTFSVALLNKWKKDAEDEMNNQLRGITLNKERPFLEADLIWSNSQRWNRGYSQKNGELYGNVIVLGENQPIIWWDLVWNFHIAIYNNSQFPAFNIKIERIAGTEFNSIEKLPNLPPYANLSLRAKFEELFEGVSTEADKLIKPKVPHIIQGLQMKISYNDEKGVQHATIFRVNGDELDNTKA
ncbi:hypothetical protein [Neptunitalea chrysea]|uniref:hypothetical protein n=1 Tax=Neptunitalea chrysea TaxID=1647581 RepID=UPI002490C160|nr:hypothetical protein [Neptunitalea chrysea]